MATSLNVGVFNKVLASTTGKYVGEFGVNVYNATPLLGKLIKKKKKWEGESTRIKVIGARYKTAQSYTDYDTGDTTRSEPFTRADYEMAGYMQWMTFSGQEIRKNQSNMTRIFDLAKGESMVALQSIKDLMATHLYQATNDAKGILSLQTITDATTTIAGIAGSSNWGGTTTTSASFAAQGKADMYTLFLTLSQYSTLRDDGQVDQPDLIIMNTTTSYRYYMSVMETGIRYTAGGKGDVGFGGITFMGQEVVPDPFCLSGNIYQLNTDKLDLYVVPSADMATGEMRYGLNQDSFTSPVLWNGGLVCTARRYQGKLASVVA